MEMTVNNAIMKRIIINVLVQIMIMDLYGEMIIVMKTVKIV